MHKIVAGQQVRWYPSGQPRVKWLWAASGACKYPLRRMCSIELKETSEVIYSTRCTLYSPVHQYTLDIGVPVTHLLG
jgi:hypothetical protein